MRVKYGVPLFFDLVYPDDELYAEIAAKIATDWERLGVEVETKAPLFDVKVEIPKRFLYVMPGEELFAKIELFNLGHIGRVDVAMDYIIKDKDGNDMLSEHETIAIETQTTLIKEFKLPEDIELGKYILYARAIYVEEVGSSSAWFNVGKKPFLKLIHILIIGTILLIILIIIFRRFRKTKAQKYKKKKSLLKTIFKKKKEKPTLLDYKKRLRKKIEKNKK